MLQSFIENIILSPLTFWNPDSLNKFLVLLGLYLGVIGIISKTKNRTAYSSLFFLFLFSIFCGVGPLMTIAFVNVAAFSIGLVLFKPKRSDAFSILISLFVGFSVIVFSLAFIVHFRINYNFVYLILLGLPILLKRRDLITLCKDKLRTSALSFSVSNVDYFLIHIFYFILLFQIIYAVAPERSFDGLTTHLMLPSHISVNHGLQIDFTRFAPALMAAGADWCYTLGYILSGETAAKLINFNFYLLILASLIYLGSLFVEIRIAFLACLLFASTPLVGLEAVTLFVDNTLTYFFITALIVAQSSELNHRTRSILFGVALGLCAQIKFSAFLFFPIAFPMYFLLVEKANRFSLNTLLRAPLIALVVAAPPYVYSYIKSGNPLYPFFNGFFKSPFYPFESFVNFLYLKPVTYLTPFSLTLESSNFLESHNGSFGIQNILFPLAFLIPLFAKNRKLFIFSTSCLVFLLFVFSQQRYLRYIYPILPVTSLLMVYWIDRVAIFKKTIVGFFVVLVAVNVYLFPTSIWFFRHFPIEDHFQSKSVQFEQIALRRAVGVINLTHGKRAKVLFLGDAFSAELEGEFDTLTWYNPQLVVEFNALTSVQATNEFLVARNYTHIVSTNAQVYPYTKSVLEYIDSNFKNRLDIGGTFLYIIKD